MKKLLSLGLLLILSTIAVSGYYEDFNSLYMNQNLGPAYGYQPLFGFSTSPYYDASSNWGRGWNSLNYGQGYGQNYAQVYGQNYAQGYGQNYAQAYGPSYGPQSYMPGLRYTPDGTEAAIYPPQYGSAQYNPYADDRNFELYQQSHAYEQQYLQANEKYDDLNYPAKQLAYLDFFARTDPRNYNMPFGYLYPYGKKPYFKSYGDPRPVTNLEGSSNGFGGFNYARNFHCHGPNFGCHVHNVFEDSA